jgi:hypothetical protein
MTPAAIAMPNWMSRLITARESAPPSTSVLHSRIEVCPPELWPSSLGWRSRVRRWLLRSPWVPVPARPLNRLAQVKQEFREAAADVPDALLDGLDDRIERARSLREFWHLRSPLYNAVAMGQNQTEADRRLARLNRHFPTRAPRGAVSALMS